MTTKGERYRASVPDTLDLAHRAGLAVNGLTGAAECDIASCESIQTAHLDHNPPYMNLKWNGPCLQKPVHALPLMRLMSGNEQNAELDSRMLKAITRDIDEDGLWWLKVENRPWRQETFKEDQVWPCPQGRLMVALLDWHKVDRNDKWLDLVGRLANGLGKIALRKEDRAWLYGAYKRSGWGVDETPSTDFMGVSGPSLTAEEPPRSGNGNIGLPLRGLSRWYAVSGDEQALDLADRLARFYMKPTCWGSVGPEMLVGPEHGHWQGRFHERTFGVMGLLEYAIVRKDSQILRFVQRFYDYARCFGIARIGHFPAILRTLEAPAGQKDLDIYMAADGSAPQCSEGCATADMIWLAATLSKAGAGDYWDDVDQYVRNDLVEHQILRRDLIEAMVAAGPTHEIDPRMETTERVIERNMGGFLGGGDPTWIYGWWTMCCNANAAYALHVAWDSIVSCENGAAQVNLLLNRASPWLDVDSYLPYEGKVVLRNKTASTVNVRVPLWADKAAVRCQVNGREKNTHWVGNYLAISGVAGGDVITVEFPMVETRETYTLPSYPDRYTLSMKGNTLVDIEPRPDKPIHVKHGSDDGAIFPIGTGYPIYLRDHYKGEKKAPVVETERYVSPALV